MSIEEFYKSEHYLGPENKRPNEPPEEVLKPRKTVKLNE